MSNFKGWEIIIILALLLLLSSAAQMAKEKRDKDSYRIAVEPAEAVAFLAALAEHPPPSDRKERAGAPPAGGGEGTRLTRTRPANGTAASTRRARPC